jgi:hypothetical protein
MSIKANLRDGPYEWLIALLLSWWIPLQLFGKWNVTYLVSLLLWLVPVCLLLPRFLRNTHRGSRRRQALFASASYIFLAGVVLDFAFGAVILSFDCPGRYLVCLRAIGGKIPIEEYLFYILGGFAVVLVYVWADMHWLAAYNVRKREQLIPAPGHLIELSPRVAITAAAMLAAGLLWRVYHLRISHTSIEHWWTVIPIYYTFLMAFAFLPLIAMYRGVVEFINWRAFSFTGLYVFLTAAIWEVTLGLPERWWGYQEKAVIGKSLAAFSRQKSYPIEALFVWIAVVFIGVFFYEFWEAYYYDPRPPKDKLFRGTFPIPPGNGPPPPPPPPPGISVIVRGRNGDPSERIHPMVRGEVLDGHTFEVISVEGGGAWRATGAAAAGHAILCFLDRGLTAAPRIFLRIAEVLESPRIVGGSTSAVPVAPLAVLKGWITGRDRGVVFCCREDFVELPADVLEGDQDQFLEALRARGKQSKRVLTRLITDAVRVIG